MPRVERRDRSLAAVHARRPTDRSSPPPPPPAPPGALDVAPTVTDGPAGEQIDLSDDDDDDDDFELAPPEMIPDESCLDHHDQADLRVVFDAAFQLGQGSYATVYRGFLGATSVAVKLVRLLLSLLFCFVLFCLTGVFRCLPRWRLWPPMLWMCAFPPVGSASVSLAGQAGFKKTFPPDCLAPA